MAPRADTDKEDGNNNRKRGGSRRKIPAVDKSTDEYKHRRERNNIAVKKSRSKSKMKTQQTLERVNSLREENAVLEGKIKLLSKELSFLKDLFLAHAGNAHGQDLKDVDWEKILSADEDVILSDNDQDSDTGTVNGEAVQNDHKYSTHASIKVQE